MTVFVQRLCVQSPKWLDSICERLANGESLHEICTTNGMPTTRSVFRWMEDNEEFRRDYMHAREMQGHTHADMAISAAVKAKDAGLGRLAYDALKWHAGKMAPKVYGDKTEVQVVGPNGGPVQSASVTVSTSDPIEASRVYQKVMSES